MIVFKAHTLGKDDFSLDGDNTLSSILFDPLNILSVIPSFVNSALFESFAILSF